MKVVIVPDSFKETLSAVKVGEAIQEGWSLAVPHTDFVIIPMSDGGEGMATILKEKYDGVNVSLKIPHPLAGSDAPPIHASMVWIPHKALIVIESAEAIGLDLIPRDERNPLLTSSWGLGVMIDYAHTHYIDTGKADTILIGIGGSATVDGGMGMAQALGVRMSDAQGKEVALGGRSLSKVAHIDLSKRKKLSCTIIVASDVQNPLYGDMGAAKVFAPQKGADASMVATLEQGMKSYAQVIMHDMNMKEPDVNRTCGGAAGGLGMALSVFCEAQIKSGITVMLEYLEFREALSQADLVITGEGKVDGQSLQGKVVYGVLQAAKTHKVPVCIIAGALDEGYELWYEHGASSIVSATPRSLPWEVIKAQAYTNVMLSARAMAGMYEVYQSQ